MEGYIEGRDRDGAGVGENVAVSEGKLTEIAEPGDLSGSGN